jgi:hypothetical protein
MGGADAMNELTSELLNLPQNITPGYSKTSNNPGETFDPQMRMTGQAADSTWRKRRITRDGRCGAQDSTSQ